MASQSKAQFLNDVHTLLKKRYKPKPERGPRGSRCSKRWSTGSATRGRPASRPTRRSRGSRTTSSTGTRSASARSTRSRAPSPACPTPSPAPHGSAGSSASSSRRRTAFTLEALTKKPLKESLKRCTSTRRSASDYVVATVIHQALGGHAIPVDAPARRALQRLGVADPEVETPALRSLLERAVPKNRGAEFLDLIEELAHDTCVEGVPDCPRCELRKVCPTGLAHKADAQTAAKHAAAVARAAAREKGSPRIRAKTPRKRSAKPAGEVAAPAPVPPPPLPVKEAPKSTKSAKGRPGGPTKS